MTDLQKEAEFVLKYLFPDNHLMTDKQRNNALNAIKSIAHSKYVQAEKLKAQIEVLEWIFNYSTNHSKIISKLEEKIEQLREQLNQLQNE